MNWDFCVHGTAAADSVLVTVEARSDDALALFSERYGKGCTGVNFARRNVKAIQDFLDRLYIEGYKIQLTDS